MPIDWTTEPCTCERNGHDDPDCEKHHPPIELEDLVIPVAAIRDGDEFRHEGYLHWTALDNPYQNDDGSTQLYVRFADGGDGWRVWDDPDTRLTVTRTVR